MSTELTYAKQTNNFKLYKECYWGNHKGLISETIANNRNTFAQKYNLMYNLSWTCRKQSKFKDIIKTTIKILETQKCFMDHIEYYDTGFSVIGVSSHFSHAENKKVLERFGFKEIPPIYQEGQTTVIMELFYNLEFFTTHTQLKEHFNEIPPNP